MQKKISVWFTLFLTILACALGYGVGLDAGYETGQSDKAAELADYCYTAADLSRQRDSIYQQAFSAGKDSGYDFGYSAGYAQGKADAKTSSQRSGSSGSSQTQSATVYVTDTGSKYHRYGCQYLRKSCNAISLATAKAFGYTPCSRCW